MTWLILLPRNIAIAFLIAYRKVVSPLYGDVCRYYPSCSRYALEAIQQHGLVAGSGMAIWRLLRCHPWAAGGIDDVKPSRRPRTISRYGFVSR